MAEPEVIDDAEDTPICPHCEKPVEKVLTKIIGIGRQHVIYFCGKCKKVLGVGYDR